MRNTCAFTGHRPEKLPWRRGETDEGCKRLKRALYNQIVRYANAGVTDYLSGMAEGVDTWAVQSVLLLRRQSSSIRLHCILPCTARADLWSVSAQERYRSILEQADSIVYVRRNYTGDCMLARNRFLVEHAALLLAVYNGEARGGTAATVRYARKLGREIWVLDPATAAIGCERGTADGGI